MAAPMEDQIVAKAVKNHAGALTFLRWIALVLHTWDDLVDRDATVSDDEITHAFWLALVDLPRNAFYREHFDDLNPILVSAILNWRIANTLERTEGAFPDELIIAFIIRSTYADLLVMSAALIGGADWAAEQGVAIKRWAHGEGFVGYQANLAAEVAARKGNHVLR